MTDLRSNKRLRLLALSIQHLLLWVCCFYTLDSCKLHAAVIDPTSLTFPPTSIYLADFENNIGDNNWSLLGGASDGNWEIGFPNPYTTGGVQMEIAAFQGSRVLLTGNGFGQDVDGGPTSARSPDIFIPNGIINLSFQYYFSHFSNSSSADYFRIEIRRASSNQLLQTIVNEFGSNTSKPANWTSVSADISGLAGETVNIVLIAADLGGGSKIEAAIDLVNITVDSSTPLSAGAIFEDKNINGIADPGELGLAGIKVVAFDSLGTKIDSSISDSFGNYMLNSLSSSQQYTLIFSNIPSGYVTSILGPDNGGEVQHIVGNAAAKLGLYQTEGYCDEDPYLILPCYVEGPLSGPYANDAAIIKFRASSDGHDFIGTNKTSNFKASLIARYNQVGSVYGIAYQSSTRSYYAASFHKRYATFGPGGPDAIYQLDLDGNVIGTIELDALTNTSNIAGTDVHNFSAINGHVYDLGINDASFNAVGRRSFGDIEMSADMNTLYVVNLFNRRIYAIDVSSGIPSNISLITSWAAPDATNSGRHRPFGLGWNQGKLWVGSVDENGSNAFVHSLDTQTGQFTLDLTIPLNYQRQAFFGNANNSNAPSNWNPWRTSANFSPLEVSREIAYPQAMLSDIEFTTTGDMILGFRDRFGDQTGADKYLNFNSNQTKWGISQGDILKACYDNGAYTLETGLNGDCSSPGGLPGSGPGGYEFYEWDIFALEQNNWNPDVSNGAFHWETTQGGLVQIDHLPYVITTAMDPFDDFSGGVIKLNNSTGARQGIPAQPVNQSNMGGGYTVFDGGDFNGILPPNRGFASKANGLGDLEAACYLPIIIGNYVWYDIDKDGLQDANEPPLANVKVELKQNGIVIGESITDAKGQYYFGGLNQVNLFSGEDITANTSYVLSIKYSETLNTSYSLGASTLALAGPSNLNSDAIISSDTTAAEISFTTGLAGMTAYDFDFGFIDCPLSTSNFFHLGCEGDGYSITIGTTTFDELNPLGTAVITKPNSCDSIVYVNLSFAPSYQRTVSYQGCHNDGYSIQINGELYNEANPRDTIFLNSLSGCDSIIFVNLTFSPDALVEAGFPIGPICSNGYVDLGSIGASISGGITTGTWTTTGDGSFNNNAKFGGAIPATTYTPGAFEIAMGVIILTLTSDDPPGPCDPKADAVMILINDLSCSQFPWVGK